MRNFRIRQEYEKKRRQRTKAMAEPHAEPAPVTEIITPLPAKGIGERIKQYFRTIWSQICQQFRDLRQ
jgi:hypothetical protein